MGVLIFSFPLLLDKNIRSLHKLKIFTLNLVNEDIYIFL
jgi:hypothetical protein